MVNSVAGALVHRPFELRCSTPGASGVVFYKVCLLYQEMENKTGELKTYGDEEEDDGVFLLV